MSVYSCSFYVVMNYLILMLIDYLIFQSSSISDTISSGNKIGNFVSKTGPGTDRLSAMKAAFRAQYQTQVNMY